MDIDSMSRAAFLCAYKDEVKRGDAHGFFVRYTKHLTVDERRQYHGLTAANNGTAFRGTPCLKRSAVITQAVSRAMMQAQFAQGTAYGKWRDVWYDPSTCPP